VRAFRIGKIPNHRYVGGDLLHALMQYGVGRLLRPLIRIERNLFGIPGPKRPIDLVLLKHITA